MTLTKFNKNNPVVAEGVRAINSMPPATTITYMTYRRWVKCGEKVSPMYRMLLLLKGIKI